MTIDKFKVELERLNRKHDLITELLEILTKDIAIRRELELVNDIPFTMRSSIEVEMTRERWQKHLRETMQDIDGMRKIIEKRQLNGRQAAGDHD